MPEVTPDETPDVSVCVAVYRAHEAPNVETLHAALDAALPGLAWELVVALNGISAADAGVPPTAVTAPLDRNMGVAAGWNAACRAGRGRTLIISNDDVAPEQGSLAILHETLEGDASIGVTGPEGSDWDLVAGRHTDWVAPEDTRGAMTDADVVSGFLFATPRRVFESVDGFDDRYNPCSFEDVDYSAKVRFDAGLRRVIVGGLHAEHEVGVSLQKPWRRVHFDGRSESLFSIWRRNRKLLRRKWGERAAQSP